MIAMCYVITTLAMCYVITTLEEPCVRWLAMCYVITTWNSRARLHLRSYTPGHTRAAFLCYRRSNFLSMHNLGHAGCVRSCSRTTQGCTQRSTHLVTRRLRAFLQYSRTRSRPMLVPSLPKALRMLATCACTAVTSWSARSLYRCCSRKYSLQQGGCRISAVGKIFAGAAVTSRFVTHSEMPEAPRACTPGSAKPADYM